MTSDTLASERSQTAVVCHAAMDTRVERRSIPEPKTGEVQIKVYGTGLCGSDLHFYLKGGGIKPLLHPMVLGHESSGVVSALGPGLPANCELKVGDKVAMEVGVPCGTCSSCKSGRYNLCPDMSFAASSMTFPHRDGTLQEYVCFPAAHCFKLPPSLDVSLAPLAEPLSVVINAFNRAHVRPGSRVLVIGTGAVGLLTCALASAGGCTTVVAVDIFQSKLDFAAQQNWVTGTILLPRGPRNSGMEACETATSNWERLKSDPVISNVEGLGRGFDAVFECSGVESCMQLAVIAAAPGSKVVFIGLGTSHFLLPTRESLVREVDLLGVFRYANTYPEALALLGSGKLGDVSKMITQRYPLERAVEAFLDLQRGSDKDGQPVIKPMVGTFAL